MHRACVSIAVKFRLYDIRCSMEESYRRCLQQALVILFAVLALCVLAAYHAQDFTFDASSETLVEQEDPELAYYESFTERFDQSPLLFMTYTPHSGSPFDDVHLKRQESLQQSLLGVAGVKSTTSVLDVPLLESPPVPLADMASDFRTLRDPETDQGLAREELTTSPVFAELLVSRDGRTTAIAIELDEPAALEAARRTRDRLRRDYEAGSVSKTQLTAAERRYDRRYERHKVHRGNVINAVRDIRDSMSGQATLLIGGVPMVAADMITFIKQDVQTFGLVVLVLIAFSLYAFFRRLRWVLIPLGTTGVTILFVIGLLGYLDKPVTVISANFIPLLAIITISFTIHLISRYRELRNEGFSDNHAVLVAESMVSKFPPCLYTALTTIVAFGSLLTSDIVPVVDFGWIMCIGILISLLVTYSFFASVLMLLPKGAAASTLGRDWGFTRVLQNLALNRRGWLWALALLATLGSAVGVTKLELGNRFVEFFRSGTEIHDGMVFIDEHLGGTIPMDVVIGFPPFDGPAESGADDGFDIFAADGVEEAYPERYWFTPEKLGVIQQLHDYLEQRPEIGKVLSLGSLEKVARRFNDDEALNYVELTAVLGMVPDDVRESLIEPYASPEAGEMRISTRLHETGPNYSLDALLDDIRRYAREDLGLEADRLKITGMAVLFNDMLRQLLTSQTSTIVFVILATLLMFALLLRSVSMAVIGMIPNLLAALTILGVMGIFGIPLDMMTITIAAIVIGIGVDDAIHYLHRFKAEYAAGGDAVSAVRTCHSSIGHALYYTSITVMIGFSVLAFSNFIPTVHFGLLAALAMVLALLANLTLLPALLLKRYH